MIAITAGATLDDSDFADPSGAEPSVQPKKRGRPPKQPASEPKTPTQAKKNGVRDYI